MRGVKPIQNSQESEQQRTLFDSACDFLKAGQAQKAVQLLEEVTSGDRGWDEAYSKLGVSYIVLGRRKDAIHTFHKAINSNPSFVPAYSNLCLAYAEEEEFERAIEYGRKGLALDPKYLPLYNSLAFALKPLGRLDEAVECMRQALAVQNGDITLQNNLASLLYENGQKEEAKDVLEEVLRQKPDHAGAHKTLSSIIKYEDGNEHIEQMEALCDSPDLSADEKSDLHFALGKAYEDVQNYERSFSHYKAGNDLNRQSIQYDVDEDRLFFEEIKAAFTQDYIKRHALEDSAQTPVFVLGMPRSGTSLVEQILASHPKVHGAGELNYLDHVQFMKQGLDRKNYVQGINSLSQSDLQNMADMYSKKAFSGVDDDVEFVTDKMPHNFRYIGLIRCLFPNAKVIHCMRDPMDVCFSIFKIKFSGNVGFAYSIKEIGEHYKLYEDLMDYWRKTFPDFIYDLDYTQLVNNQESSIRSLLDFCGLGWDERCMAFHKNKRAVTTASALQVRQPIYKSALQYWKNYEQYLGELKEVLKGK